MTGEYQIQDVIANEFTMTFNDANTKGAATINVNLAAIASGTSEEGGGKIAVALFNIAIY